MLRRRNSPLWKPVREGTTPKGTNFQSSAKTGEEENTRVLQTLLGGKSDVLA